MTTITTIQSSDLITNSRADINNNFSNLNTDKVETSVIDTDTTLAANSDSKIPSQKAIKAYVDSGGNPNASETQAGINEEATDAEVTAGIATGATGAKLFVTPAKLATQAFAKTSDLSAYQPTMIFKSGVITRNAQGADGAVATAHNLGKVPKKVRLTARYSANDTISTSDGVYTSSGNHCVWGIVDISSTNGTTGNSSAAAIFITDNVAADNSQTGVITVDATNITITWAYDATMNAGTIDIMWEAEA